eukprot:CAMPEP_0202456416 /NCGR_PEP_ID=MMETSP1360-20130828/13672_1 /ASSEMBLY_ACC=CAM_ASM_000848 /TAXON_ID=515479 /ORGANISM="Licmophora paradoxa, Strain CCMP2313" /LENGTH=311 /DNA_ID=CAMNT_0049076205 /DNA_START=72 /DNA_END=1007 /DNA_ORIENTATION=-
MSAIAKKQKNKADTLVEAAEAALNKKSWFSSKEKKYEDAVEMYDKAGNAYKVGGFYYEAGEAYSKAGHILRDNLKNSFDSSKAFQNAGSNFKKADAEKAVEAYNAAILIMTDAGRVMNAAKLSKECAQIYENDGIETEEKSNIVWAIEAYEQAAELFAAEDANSQGSQCLVKVAELCSAALDPPDLERASQIYDDLGRRCLDSNLLKFNARGYFLQSILCHLANGDGVGAQQAKDRYESLDYTFTTAREGKFAQQLIDAVEGYDSEGFSTACYDYNRVSNLDPWKTTILLKVQKSIAAQESDDDDEEVDLR